MEIQRVSSRLQNEGMRHPEIQLRSFGWSGRVAHPPATAAAVPLAPTRASTCAAPDSCALVVAPAQPPRFLPAFRWDVDAQHDPDPAALLVLFASSAAASRSRSRARCYRSHTAPSCCAIRFPAPTQTTSSRSPHCSLSRASRLFTRPSNCGVRNALGLKCQTCSRPFIMPRLPSNLPPAGSQGKTALARSGPAAYQGAGTTKGRVCRKNCSVELCDATTEKAAAAVKWLISMAHFPTPMAIKMHNVALRR